jgi:hypothetical protein
MGRLILLDRRGIGLSDRVGFRTRHRRATSAAAASISRPHGYSGAARFRVPGAGS